MFLVLLEVHQNHEEEYASQLGEQHSQTSGANAVSPHLQVEMPRQLRTVHTCLPG